MKARNTLALSCAMALVAGIAAIPSSAQMSGDPVRSKTDASIHRKNELKSSAGRKAIRSGSRVRPAQSGGLAGATIIDEGFDGFANGPVNGQFGWTTFDAAASAPVVSPTTPISGTKSVELDNGGATAGTLNGIFSPTSVQSAGNYIATAKIRIPNTGGADYDVVFQSNTQALLTSQVKFFFGDADGDTIDGDIVIADGANGDFQITGFEYTPGTTHTLKVVLDVTNGQQRYYLDNTLIWVGTVWAGTAIDQAVLFSDSFQLTGEIGRVDDVRVEPGVQALCPGNVNGDANVNVTDLLAVISAWGVCVDCVDAPCAADLNSDCNINVTDLLAVISGWGACQQAPTGACCINGVCSGPVTFISCINAGGVFQGGSVACADVTCPTPASNDHPIDAIDITANINGATIDGDNVGATPVDGAGPDTDIPSGFPSCNWLAPAISTSNTVWYKFTAPAGGAVSLNLCASLSAGFSDGDLAIFSGTPGSLVQVACDDFSCPPANTFPYNASITSAAVTPGQVYYVLVSNAGGWSGSVSGPFVLGITAP